MSIDAYFVARPKGDGMNQVISSPGRFSGALILGLAIASIAAVLGCGKTDTGTTSSPVAASTIETPEKGTESSEPAASDGKENAAADQALPSAAAADHSKIASDSIDAQGNIVLDPAVAVSSTDAQPAAIKDLVNSNRSLPVEANVATEEERNQKIAVGWEKPQAVFLISGQQNGYLEPCGCTGLDKQKGGIARRDRLLQDLMGRGWNLIPIDVGNQVRRVGSQPEIQLQTTAEAFKLMGYRAVTYGSHDLKLASTALMASTVPDTSIQTPYVSANVTVLIPDMLPKSKVFTVGGRKIGLTGVLGHSFRSEVKNDEITVEDPIESLKPVIADLQKQQCDFNVLLLHGSLEEARDTAKKISGIHLIVCGGLGDPEFVPEKINDTSTLLVQTGVKGMYVVLLGLFDDPKEPIKYQRVALSSQFKDSTRMLELFARYQEQLKSSGFKDLGATPMNHPSGNKFVGSDACADCHTKAFDVWKNSPHFDATTDLVKPGERTMIPRHFDPECISCHATGWHPQEFLPYVSGYESLEKTPMMTGSGCENCHGPGSNHVAAENADIEVSEEQRLKFVEQMRLPLARAHDKCIQCHDIDNSPDFHHEGAFEKYWEQVKHVGKD